LISPGDELLTLKQFITGANLKEQISTAINEDRFDSEYYLPRYLHQEIQLEMLTPSPLSQYATVSDGNHVKISHLYQDKGIPYLRGSDLTDFFLVNTQPTYIDKGVYNGLARSHMKEGDVLLSIVGTIGKVAIVTDKFPLLTGSCKLAIIRPHSINSYFLATYLASNLGQDQIARRVRGTVQQGLILPDLHDFPVPKVEGSQEKEIETLVKESYYLEQTSERSHAVAESLLLAVLGLEKLDLSPKLTYKAMFDEVKTAERFDSEYYQPKYHHIINTMEQSGFPIRRLGQIIEPILNGFDYRNYEEEGTPYIRVGDVRNGRIDLAGAAKVPITLDDVGKNIGLQVNDILFTRKGTFGQAAVVREGQEHAIISSEIMLLRLRDNGDLPLLPDYLSLFLNSPVGFQQIERRVHGVAYYSISQTDLATVRIAIPSIQIQEKLADKVQNSLRAEKEAKQLLEFAKQRVEQMIFEKV
jgi:restriction endonuclease S subunit